MKTVISHYKEDVTKSLMKDFGFSSVMAIPKITKVVVNTGVGSLKDDNKRTHIIESLRAITGVNPLARKAKTSIASFKLREGQIIGYASTLRGKRMDDFLTKLIHVAIPRIRDFRGLSLGLIDNMGNLSIGFKDHTVFPEAGEEDVRSAFGLGVNIVTTAKTKDEARALFLGIGIPFIKEETVK